MTEKLAMSKQNWPPRPEGTNWDDFGADDNLGRLNLLTPEKRTHKGLAFVLSLPLHLRGTGLKANRLPPATRPNLRQGHVNFSSSLGVLNAIPAVLNLRYPTSLNWLVHAVTCLTPTVTVWQGSPTTTAFGRTSRLPSQRCPPATTSCRQVSTQTGGTSSSGCSRGRNASPHPNQPPQKQPVSVHGTQKDLL